MRDSRRRARAPLSGTRKVKRNLRPRRREFARLQRRPERSCETGSAEERMTAAKQSSGDSRTVPTLTSVLAQIAALKTASTTDLKRQWQELFGTEPPPFNRAYLQSRLAFRI